MRVPFPDALVVEEAKLTGYLLDIISTKSKGKASFFYHFGFTLEDWQMFADALRQHAFGI